MNNNSAIIWVLFIAPIKFDNHNYLKIEQHQNKDLEATEQEVLNLEDYRRPHHSSPKTRTSQKPRN